jgi:hypothetical protein
VLAGFADLEALADAQDDPEAGLEGDQDLAGDAGVGLAEVGAALGVTDDRPVGAGVERASPGRPRR